MSAGSWRPARTAAPLYRDAPEAAEASASGTPIFHKFMREGLPGVPKARSERAGDLIKTTLSTVGQRFSERPRSAAEIKAYADSLADMFCAYVKILMRATPRQGAV